MRDLFFVSFLLSLGFLWFAGDAFAQGPGIEINRVEIRGNRKIDAETIRSKLKTNEGDLFSVERLREDVKTIYEMGYFSDVQVESEPFEGGIQLSFVVSEKPFVVEVGYLGNRHLKADKLREKVPFRTETFLDLLEVNEVAEKIRKTYQEEGYYNAEVIPVIRSISPEKVAVQFAIDEKERARIEKVDIEGNQKLATKQIKKVMESQAYFWLTSWWTGKGRYQPEKVSADVERIRDLYLNHGYLEVQVGTPVVRLDEEKTGFSIVIPVVEGEPFAIDRIGFTGNQLYEDSVLRSVVQSQEDRIFNRDQIRQDIVAIVDLYGEKGYAFANVVPRLEPDPSSRKVAVTFEVTEGGPVRVRRINIFGNNKTRDKVIRRELRLNERDLLDTRAMRRSFQRINNLNYFENVEIVPREIETGWVDLDVRIQEKLTGTFSVGGGYSSVDRFVGLVQLEQGNLFGRGQLMRLRAELGSRRTNFNLSFREPYLFDYEVSGTVNLFNQVRTFTEYKEERSGGSLILGRAFSEYVSGSVSYTLEALEVVDAASTTSSRILEQQALGRTLTSAVGLSLAYDTRDFFFDPREGFRHSISMEWAGTVLGGDNAYYRVIGDSSRFYPLFTNTSDWLYPFFWRTVLSIHGRVGYAQALQGKTLPLGERFFVGGINTVRGFDFGDAGPVDPVTGEILGGDKELIVNVEYLFPLVPEANIKGVFFFDAGRGFDDHERIGLRDLRLGAGAGVRWVSPIGPLRLEWGYNLDRREGERPSKFEFSIGTLF